MGVRAYLQYVIMIFLLNGIHCPVVEKYYKSSQNIAATQNSEFHVNVTRRSEIGCASACSQEHNCNSFSFHKETGQCSMSSGITENISDRVYYIKTTTTTQELTTSTTEAVTSESEEPSSTEITTAIGIVCPTSLGYTLWTYGGMSLCVKYVSAKLVYAGAKAACENDGDHLALVKNEATRLFMVDFLTAAGASNLQTWFDGYDVGDQDIFRTWNGDVLWVSWASASGKHSNGADCMAGKITDGLLSREASCTIQYPYVCQVDLF